MIVFSRGFPRDDTLDLVIGAIDFMAQTIHNRILANLTVSPGPTFELPTDLIHQLDGILWNEELCPRLTVNSPHGPMTVMMMTPVSPPITRGNVTMTGPTPLTAPSVTIVYDNLLTVTRKPRAYKWGRTIALCENLFQPRPGSPSAWPIAKRQEVAAVLFHELVHVCGGNELDAEAYEEIVFAALGATPPDEDDWKVFEKRNWKGRWVHLKRRISSTTDADVKNNFGGLLCTLAASNPQMQTFLGHAPITDLG